MLPFVQVGPLLVQLPGLAILAGIWVGINFVEKEALRLLLPAGRVINMITLGLVAGLLGARVLYALAHSDAYLASPLGIFALNTTALDPLGGILVGFALAFLYARRNALPLRPTLDALAPGVAVFMLALALASLLSGNGYGAPSSLPWAIKLWGEYRHPTQIYELVLALGVLLLWRFAPAGALAQGNSFWQVIGLLAAARLFTEAFHADSAALFGGLRLVQVVSLLLLAIAVWVARRWASTDAMEGRGPRRTQTTRRAPARRAANSPRRSSPTPAWADRPARWVPRT